MTERATTEVFFCKDSLGDRHWVSGQAYPPEAARHYAALEVMDFPVDARVVYSSAADSGGRWGVMLTDPPQGVPDHFKVDIPHGLAFDERYGHLVDAVEVQLGRTGLTMLVS